jgi:cysteinyl-tRNA synthetase
MLRLFNTLGGKLQTFRPVKEDRVTVFTCGPSVYLRSHIGNFRTFLFEDVLVAYLRLLGHNVLRGMNITDVEDKSIEEAKRRGVTLKELTDRHINEFTRDMGLLNMETPQHLPRAGDYVQEAADIIDMLLKTGAAYRYKNNIYFDPSKYKGFGKLFGLDMKRWPRKKVRFHKDTYPGVRWNLGDFILWHGEKGGDEYVWETKIGRGRPSWNVEDASMVASLFKETLSIYCGGADNLYRHHDYTLAILESVRPYPMARYWLHSENLLVDGRKMSKSKGNIIYTDTLLRRGISARKIRFFLIYSQYRQTLDFSLSAMAETSKVLKELIRLRKKIEGTASRHPARGRPSKELLEIFRSAMDNDLDVKGAVDRVRGFLLKENNPARAHGILAALKEIDKVLKVLF